MRHRKRSKKLSRTKGPRDAVLRNQSISLLKHQRIKTTKTKAKQTQSMVEHLILLGKKDTLWSRRNAYRILNDRDTVVRLFSKIAPIFKEKSSGFSRIIHYLPRHGDGAEMVFLELTNKLPKEQQIKPKKEKEKQKPIQPRTKTQAQPEAKLQPETKLMLSQEKEKEKEKSKFKPKLKPSKEIKPKKLLGGLRKLFKRERDAL